MMKHLVSFLAILAFCWTGLAAAAPASTAAPTRAPPPPDLAVGQMWSIKTSSNLTAKVIIGAIEPPQDGQVTVHVSIVEITGADPLTSISHSPFEKAALVGSLDKLLKTGVKPPEGFVRGVEQWKAQDGGVYTISVEDALALTIAMLHRPPRAAPGSAT
jgi:hypothetical protein